MNVNAPIKAKTFNRKLARKQWRSQFDNPIMFRQSRQAGRACSFRSFTHGQFNAEGTAAEQIAVS